MQLPVCPRNVVSLSVVDAISCTTAAGKPGEIVCLLGFFTEWQERP